MIYDYADREGWVSIWVGNCDSYDALDRYLSTVYLEEWENWEPHPKALAELEKIFLPENRDRPCEEELREMFNGEMYNRFEYDFGLSFDEDFREAEVFPGATRDMGQLLEPFSCSGDFIPAARALDTSHLPECNAAVLLYNLRYTGGVQKAEQEGVSLRFLGSFPCQL